MSEEYLVRYCSPTLAGIQTGSLLMCPMDSRENVIQEISRYNQLLLDKGLCMVPVKFNADSVLIYVFRPKRLENDLNAPMARKILKNAGYGSSTCMGFLSELLERVRKGGDFPHEIGLFLSYPPEDVKGFMDNSAENYKCVGDWKVYGDVNAAKRTFALYDRCKKTYCRLIKKGMSLRELVVAV